MAFWLVLSGHYEPRLIGLGIGSVVLVVYMAIRMGVVDEEGVPLHLAGRAVIYVVWLLKEIFVANVRVSKIILDPNLPIDPVIVRYPARQRTDLGRVLYANSITLTPGTITTHVEERELEVHSLAWDEVDGREEDVMSRWVNWVEQGGRG